MTVIGNASKAYKEANNRSQVSLDPSSESLQEDSSSDSQSEGESANKSPTKADSSHTPPHELVQAQIEQNPGILNVSSSGVNQHGSSNQQKECTVVQMETDPPAFFRLSVYRTGEDWGRSS